MFTDTQATSSFAAPDLEAVRAFYADTLGIRTSSDDMGNLVLHLGGGREVFVYPKPDHQPANYTILHFEVSDLDAAVDGLVEKGVTMERYDGFGQDEKGIARENQGGPGIAWFTDPAGNILGVATRM